MTEAEQFNRQVAEARLFFIDTADGHGYRRAISETIKAFSPDVFAALAESAKAKFPAGSRNAKQTPEQIEAIARFRELWNRTGDNASE